MTQTTELIHEIDWDFADADTSEPIHSIHPYPARFIPQIPSKLIELFPPSQDEVVLDPFCGSGTTLVESARRGIDAWGVDVHPLACQLSRVKTTPVEGDLILSKAARVGEEAETLYREGELDVPNIPNLDHWFERPIQEAVAATVHSIEQVEEQECREALEVALSSILVRVSNQDSDTRYAAVDKDVSPADVFSGFQRASVTVAEAIDGVRSEAGTFGEVEALNEDLLELEPEAIDDEVGLVVTSPPYPNVYEYWLYHKYRMWWLDMDPIDVREKEIGARPKYFTSDPEDEEDFRAQMQSCFQFLRNVTSQEAKVCFLVGRSIIRGKKIDNVEILRRAAEPEGFRLSVKIERNIPSSSGSFNPAHGGDKKEHVVVFERTDQG